MGQHLEHIRGAHLGGTSLQKDKSAIHEGCDTKACDGGSMATTGEGALSVAGPQPGQTPMLHGERKGPEPL